MQRCDFDSELLAYCYPSDEEVSPKKNLASSEQNSDNSSSKHATLDEWAPLRPHITSMRGERLENGACAFSGVPSRRRVIPAVWHQREMHEAEHGPTHECVQMKTPEERREDRHVALQNLPKQYASRRVVYDFNDRKAGRCVFVRLIPKKNCLAFDSHFESGNLLKAERIFRDRSAVGNSNTGTHSTIRESAAALRQRELTEKLFGMGFQDDLARGMGPAAARLFSRRRLGGHQKTCRIGWSHFFRLRRPCNENHQHHGSLEFLHQQSRIVREVSTAQGKVLPKYALSRKNNRNMISLLLQTSGLGNMFSGSTLWSETCARMSFTDFICTAFQNQIRNLIMVNVLFVTAIPRHSLATKDGGQWEEILATFQARRTMD